MARRGGNSGCGCGTLFAVLIILGSVSTYWPLILGVVLIGVIVFAVRQSQKNEKRQAEEAVRSSEERRHKAFDDVKKYKDLLDDGIIDAEQYEGKRRELVAILLDTEIEAYDEEAEAITALRRYKELLDDGILTAAEFEQKKRELLPSLMGDETDKAAASKEHRAPVDNDVEDWDDF